MPASYFFYPKQGKIYGMEKATKYSFSGFLIGVVIAGLASFGLAAFFGMTIGGIATAIAPDFHFNLVGDFVCPEDTTFEYHQVRYSYHHPGEYTIEARCVDNEGQAIENQVLKAIGSIMGLYFLSCFVPLFVLGIIFSGILMRLLNKALKRR
jgi:hypothetical protein